MAHAILLSALILSQLQKLRRSPSRACEGGGRSHAAVVKHHEEDERKRHLLQNFTSSVSSGFHCRLSLADMKGMYPGLSPRVHLGLVPQPGLQPNP